MTPWPLIVLAHKTRGVGDYRKDFWKRIAFATRYGHQELGTVMAMPVSDLNSYTTALGELISEENTVPGRND